MSHPVREWLEKEREIKSAEELLQQLGERLLASGVPVWRCATSIWPFHPEVAVHIATWERGRGVRHLRVARKEAMSMLPARDYSPVIEFTRDSPPLRVRLSAPAEEIRWEVMRELRDEGGTDYYVWPIRAGGGIRPAYCSFTTDSATGFTDEHLAILESLRDPIELQHRICTSEHVMRELLTVYLGQNAARRVLAGAFVRGSGEEIRAAVLFSDLRGFTELAGVRPVKELIEMLDGYFEAVAEAVMANGGEVLKFIGDAVLAIFDANTHGETGACERALTAAETALAKISSEDGKEGGAGRLRVGMGLHFGDVLYGNVGGKERLDFTVIGTAVNIASRVESACKEKGTSLLLTDAVRSRLERTDLVALGATPLKGVESPVELFAVGGRRAPSEPSTPT